MLRLFLLWPVVVVALIVVVHMAGHAAADPVNAPVLSRAAAEMRDAILTAAHARRYDDLKSALELNEMPPDLGLAPGADAIAFFKGLPRDGEGRDMFAILEALLSGPPAVVPYGRDIENNRIFVWPALAERVAGELTAADEGDLIRLAGRDEAAKIKTLKRWTWWRIAIGADGTWHALRREN